MMLLFSDIDGTCVHYEDLSIDLTPHGNKLEVEFMNDGSDGRLVQARFESNDEWTSALLLPPSTSGAQGVISCKTIALYAAIRAMGFKLILISGCRSSTLFQRLPYLPAADAYVCESGGRIFYPDATIPTAIALKEDMSWRRMHFSATGDLECSRLAPEDRRGVPLWEQYNALRSAGLRVDAKEYTTAFRVKISREDWQTTWAATLLPGLSVAENLGAIDCYPSTSGKLKAAQYLMSRFGGDVTGSDSLFMCDDDNDIELAVHVSRAYLPSITSESMRRVVERAAPGAFLVAKRTKMAATEEILQVILNDAIVCKD